MDEFQNHIKGRIKQLENQLQEPECNNPMKVKYKLEAYNEMYQFIKIMKLITVLEIATNQEDLLIEAAQDEETKKYTSMMYLLRDGNIHKLMLSFNTGEGFAGWDTADAAIEEMVKLKDAAISYAKREGFID